MNKEQRKSLRQTAKFLLLASFVAFAASFFMKGRLPGRHLILDDLLQNPVQTENDVPRPFDVTRKDVTYTVTPVFSYELWGMVVSYHHASSFVDIAHEMWKDNINIKDMCILWGKNLETGVYANMKFRNRDFTCYYRYPDRETGELFDANRLSNNHLLPADPIVARKIMKARKGDQVTFRGWLVSYGHKGSPYQRKTSTTRTDRGNGACETVYVTDFEILRKANTEWRALHKLSLALIIVCTAALFFL